MCSSQTVDRAQSPTSLRRLIDACKNQPDVALKALSKLNSSPIPENLIAKLRGGRSLVGGGGGSAQKAVERVSFEAAIYFGSGEAFPTDDGFRAMFELVERVNATGGYVKSVVLAGTVDSMEAETTMARQLALGRAALLHRYLVAAGVDRSLIQTGIKIKSDSATTVPNDRAAYAILVVELPT